MVGKTLYRKVGTCRGSLQRCSVQCGRDNKDDEEGVDCQELEIVPRAAGRVAEATSGKLLALARVNDGHEGCILFCPRGASCMSHGALAGTIRHGNRNGSWCSVLSANYRVMVRTDPE